MRDPTQLLIIIRYIALTLLVVSMAASFATAFSSAKAPPLPFCLNVKLVVHPDQREAFLSNIKHDREQSLSTEPACLQFVLGEDVETPNTFYLHEEYKNEAGFVAHTQTPHFAKWKEFCDTNPWGQDDKGPVVDFYHGEHTAQEFPIHHPAYCLNVNLYPKPEVRERFLEVIAANKQGSDEKEPLCLQYVYGESTEAPNTFHFHEQYKGADDGKEGFEAHTNAPHFSAWEAFASNGEPFEKAPEVNFFKTLP